MTEKWLQHRIFRSKDSDYVLGELESCLNTHSEERLKAIAAAGFTGIWVRGKLREIAPTGLFAKYYPQAGENLKRLQILSERARQCGLGLWLYFTEPLGMEVSNPFWREHPDLCGCKVQVYDFEPQYSLCSSTKAVQDYLKNGFTELAGNIDLQGIVLITASEHINNCWAHVLTKPENFDSAEDFWLKQCQCPRCRTRKPAEVIAEIIRLIHDGLRSGKNAKAKLVAWDWSWNMNANPPYNDIVNRLPEEVVLMGDFERGGKINRLGREVTVEEYSLMYSGPSERFTKEVSAYAADREMFARFQLNTTHELGTVSSLPMIVSLYRKLKYLLQHNIAGAMMCWNFATETETLNVFALKYFREHYEENEERWLEGLAAAYFGKQAKEAVLAWKLFHEAGAEYPLNGNKFVYFSPVSYALGYDLKPHFAAAAMGSCDSREPHGDRLEESYGSFTLQEIITLLENLAAKWKKACAQYEKAAGPHVEINNAWAAYHCFRSTRNIYQWYRYRKPNQDKPVSNEGRQIIEDEIENLQAALKVLAKDNRLGFHQEARMYLFNTEIVNAKIVKLKKMLASGQ